MRKITLQISVRIPVERRLQYSENYSTEEIKFQVRSDYKENYRIN